MGVLFFLMCLAAMQGYVSANCGYPGSPAHCLLRYSNETLHYGTVVTYECEPGFELLGPARRICDGFQWQPEGIPFCGYVSANCGYPGSPAHCLLRYSNETLHYGTVVTYECEPGFELLGPARRICDGFQWQPEGIPFCVLNVAAGKAPMQSSNEEGGSSQKAVDGSTSAIYTNETCSLTKPERSPWWYVNLLEPYMVQLVRLDFGVSCCGPKQAIIVVRVGNNRPDLGTNPICNRYTGYIQEGQPLFLPCNPPMPGAFVSVHLESPTPIRFSICETFVYTDQALPIERCPQFRDNPPGSIATYNGKCYMFYDRSPADFVSARLRCIRRDGDLVFESNAALQGFLSWELWRRHKTDFFSKYWLGATRDPHDPSSWIWVRGENVTLSFWNSPNEQKGDCAYFDGSKGWLWSNTDCNERLNFVCQHQPMNCGRPEQPPHSTMYGDDFRVGREVKYECDPGYILIGPSVRTCQYTGFYDEFAPVCKLIDCGDPPEIENGYYRKANGNSYYKSTVQYYCDEGYKLVGASDLSCALNEHWDDAPPTCISLPPPTTTTTTTTSTTTTPAPTTQTSTTPPPPTTRHIPPPRTRPTRPAIISSPTPFITPESRRPRPKTTEHTTKAYERPTKAYERPPERKVTVTDAQESPTSHIPHIIVANHPRENQILGNGNNIRAEQTPRVNVPFPVDGERREPVGARLNIGAVVALGAFGALVFLIAIITTIVILVRSRKHHDGKRYRHHVSPDCNTVASLDSSSSESRSGLNRYYRQAWEELHEAAGKHPHRRHDREAPKDGSELVVSDVYPAPHRDKRRHHHHHHHREPRHAAPGPYRSHHNHKPRY